MAGIEHSLPYDQLVHTIVRKINQNPSIHDDLVQVGRMAVMQGLESYNAGTGKMSEYAWICKYIVRDVCREIGKEILHQDNHLDVDDLSDLDDVDELIDYDHQHLMEVQTDIFNMLSAMPEPERRMVIAHIFDDMSYTEIAYANSLNKQAVYRIVTTGMEILRERFS